MEGGKWEYKARISLAKSTRCGFGIHHQQTEDTEKLQRDLSDRVDRFKDSLNNQWDGEEVPRDSDYDLNDLDIEYEYDRFTRRAALATLGLWGFLTARSTQELINDKTAAKDAREYLAAISIDIKQAEIDYRIATPLRHAGGPTKVWAESTRRSRRVAAEIAIGTHERNIARQQQLVLLRMRIRF
eukprot:jgi/Bigna1/139743/aug1.52_g14451